MPKFELKFYRTYGQYAYEIVTAADEEEAQTIAERLADDRGPRDGKFMNSDGESVGEDDLLWDEEDDGGVIEGPRLSKVTEV